MLINVAPPGPPQMLEMSVFGRASPELNAYIHQRNQAVDHRLQHHYGQAGQQFMQQSTQFYQNYAESTGVKAAEAMILSTASVLNGNLSENLVPLETYEQLQSAHRRYQEYLMANPFLRGYYLEDRVEGYVDTYENREGLAIGFNQLAYREVVTGMSRSSYDPDFDPYDKEQTESWVTTTQDSLDGEPELKFLEKVNITNAWSLQNAALIDNIDPSSIDGFEVRPSKG